MKGQARSSSYSTTMVYVLNLIIKNGASTFHDFELIFF